MKELFGIPIDTLLISSLRCSAWRLVPSSCLRYAPRAAQARSLVMPAAAEARSALIVVGLMLGTTIIAAALDGDTMNHTIRSTAVSALGETDEVVSARGAVEDIPGELTGRLGHRLLLRADRRRSERRPRAVEPGRRRRRRDPQGRRRAGAGPAADRAERVAVRARSGTHGGVRADSERRGRRGRRSRTCVPESSISTRSGRPDARACAGSAAGLRRSQARADAHSRDRSVRRRRNGRLGALAASRWLSGCSTSPG